MPITLLDAESGQSIGWLIVVLLSLICKYGWIVSLVGFASVWLLRRAKQPATAVFLVVLFMFASLLLVTSIVLNCLAMANVARAKSGPPSEARKALEK